MATQLHLHEGILRPSLVTMLEAFSAPGRRVSTYYLDFGAQMVDSTRGMLIVVKNFMAETRERLKQLDAPHAVREALKRDWEMVRELGELVAGERETRSLACYVSSETGEGWAFHIPRPIRNRVFFEERFVLWPLHAILDQADRYGICLTNKETGRLFLYFLGRIEEISEIYDQIPGNVRFPDPLGELKYRHKHMEHFHRHFEHAAESALRLFQREPFEHLIIGGLWETLPQFEVRLHRYLQERLIARWDIDIKTPWQEILKRAQQEEQKFNELEAREVWKTIQDQRSARGALGADEVFVALWQQRVQTLLEQPNVVRPGFRCKNCGRLQLSDGPCAECSTTTTRIADVYEEAVHLAVEQSAQVCSLKDPALQRVDSIAALKRF
jgi:peptide subunit release factor 1 (eRF1)